MNRGHTPLPMIPITGLLLTIILLIGCSDPETRPYAAPPQTGAEVRAELADICQAAVANKQPVLVEFSAPWCSDCQRLQRMKQESVLVRELAEWPNATINVGRFDLHRDMLDSFGIEKIANWSIFQPTDCDAPFELWPRVISRTLEPSSGAERDTSPSQLAQWLRNFRLS